MAGIVPTNGAFDDAQSALLGGKEEFDIEGESAAVELFHQGADGGIAHQFEAALGVVYGTQSGEACEACEEGAG